MNALKFFLYDAPQNIWRLLVWIASLMVLGIAINIIAFLFFEKWVGPDLIVFPKIAALGLFVIGPPVLVVVFLMKREFVKKFCKEYYISESEFYTQPPKKMQKLWVKGVNEDE